METMNDILSRMEAAYEEASGHPAQAVSDTGVRLRVLAGELLRLRAQVEWLRRQAFPETADGQWLDRHGEARGLSRHPAQSAIGSLTFTRYIPLTFDLQIPAGVTCASTGEDPVEVVTTQAAVLPAGSLTVTVPAKAVAPGPGGNLSAGAVNTMIDPPEGIQYVNNTAPFTGGQEAESDEVYRTRVMAAYRQLPNPLNAAWYRDAALSVEGVGSVQVVPRVSGAGTVGVYVWGTAGAPSADLLNQVRAVLEEGREIAVTVTVAAATASTRDVDARLRLAEGADFTQANAAITQALTDWFAAREVGDPLYLTQLEQVILSAAPVLQIEWPVTMQDLAPSAGRMLLLGDVTLEALS